MGRSWTVRVLLFAILISGISVAAQSRSDPYEKGEYVVVDGQRVFVPSIYVDRRSPLRTPEKIARDILRGRAIIEKGNAKTTFRISPKGTEIAILSIDFDPGEPQTLREQIPYVRERVNAFNRLLRESGMPVYDTAAGAGAGLLVALKVLGRNDPLGTSKRWQARFKDHILTSEAYQGRPDEENQANYEFAAFFAIEAMNELKKAQTARSVGERSAAQQKSRRYADIVLAFFTKGWPELLASAKSEK